MKQVKAHNILDLVQTAEAYSATHRHEEAKATALIACALGLAGLLERLDESMRSFLTTETKDER